MKKGQELEGYVERLEFGGRGKVTVDGRTVTVKNVLEGQKIRFRITKARAKGSEGRLLEVLEPSPKEIAPDCPHFGECGGCSLRSLPYEEQLALKEKQIRTLLAPYMREEDFEGIYPSPRRCGYRNKMEYTFGDACKDGPLTLGLHKRGSYYDILTCDQCRIADEDFGAVLRAVLELARRYGFPYFHKQTHIGYLRHLLIRKAQQTGQILICLVTSSQAGQLQEEAFLDEFTRILCNLTLKGRIVGILHTVNDSLADVIRNDRTDILYGQDYFYETILGLTFRITPFSFFQNNSGGSELLYQKAREYIGDTKDKIIFDLYSGTGTITQILAPAAKSVTGVEIVEEAVEAARANAQANGLTNCSFIAGDVLKVLDELPEKPDLIMLDPPRDGIHPKALTRIIGYQVERIVYISCKPTSLARDLEAFLEGGYRVEKGSAFDMFPGTEHVETVVLLGRKKDRDYISIPYEPKEGMFSGKEAEKKGTYGNIQNYVQSKYGCHVSHLNIAQVKRKHGIIERENYNKGAEGHKVPECTKEKERMIEEALEHFKMIETYSA